MSAAVEPVPVTAVRGSFGGGFAWSWTDLKRASATRLAPASGAFTLVLPGARGDSIAISFSMKPCLFQKIRKAWSNSRLCSCFLTKTACSVV